MYRDHLIWCVYCTTVVLTCFVMIGCFGNKCTYIYLYVLVFTVFCIVCTVFLYCFGYVYFISIILSVLV
jgi:hypothetical protein